MAGETKVADVSEMKPGSLMIIDGAACKVISVDVSRPGKHGHAKFRILAVGIIDEKKRDIVMPHQSIEVPIIGKKEAQVLSVTGDVCNVMDSVSFETLDLKIPEELKGQIQSGQTIIYWEILDAKVLKQIANKG